MDDELQPDALGKKIRVGCGATAGVVVGLFLGIVYLGITGRYLWLFVAVSVITFAYLALRYGDRFWLKLLEGIGGIH